VSPTPFGRLGQHPPHANESLSVRHNIYGETATIALDLQVILPTRGSTRFATRRIPSQADSSAAPTIRSATASCTIRACWRERCSVARASRP